MVREKTTKNIWLEELHRSVHHWTSQNHSVACYNNFSQVPEFIF